MQLNWIKTINYYAIVRICFAKPFAAQIKCKRKLILFSVHILSRFSLEITTETYAIIFSFSNIC